VFENRVLRRIFGPKRDEVTGEWRKLHNELHNLYSPPNIIRVIKSRMLFGWCIWCAWMGLNMNTFWFESVMGGDHSEDLGIDGRIILK
jgi:hypothetical protein